jgi:PTH2 family peptidyl-tRNA hydrolase
MKTIEQLRTEEDLDVLFQEVRDRQKLIGEMVGTLYPSILTDEISVLNEMIYELRRHEPKQVIVMRKDLNMRKGKMIAQGAHASMGVLLYMMEKEESTRFDGVTPVTTYTLHADGYVRDWLRKKFTKVTVSVNSEQELLDIYEKAKHEGLPAVLITDSGLTEFGGVPTNTCCAIGPYRRDEIDTITGHLSLL